MPWTWARAMPSRCSSGGQGGRSARAARRLRSADGTATASRPPECRRVRRAGGTAPAYAAVAARARTQAVGRGVAAAGVASARMTAARRDPMRASRMRAYRRRAYRRRAYRRAYRRRACRRRTRRGRRMPRGPRGIRVGETDAFRAASVALAPASCAGRAPGSASWACGVTADAPPVCASVWPTACETKRCTAPLSRKRTSCLAGWTLTSTAADRCPGTAHRPAGGRHAARRRRRRAARG